MDGGKYTMLKDGDSYSLVVSEVYGEDADEYACRAVNKGGSRTSRAELFIKSISWCFPIKLFFNLLVYVKLNLEFAITICTGVLCQDSIITHTVV